MEFSAQSKCRSFCSGESKILEGHSATDLAGAMLHRLLESEGIEMQKPGADPFARKDAPPVRPTAARPEAKPAPAAQKTAPAPAEAPLLEPVSSGAVGERPYAEDKPSSKEPAAVPARPEPAVKAAKWPQQDNDHQDTLARPPVPEIASVSAVRKSPQKPR